MVKIYKKKNTNHFKLQYAPLRLLNCSRFNKFEEVEVFITNIPLCGF